LRFAAKAGFVSNLSEPRVPLSDAWLTRFVVTWVPVRTWTVSRLIVHLDSGFAIDSRYCFSAVNVETVPVSLLSTTVVLFFPSGETVILFTVSILPSRL
jgi:hypothetical protein